MSLIEDIKEHYKSVKYPPIDEWEDTEVVHEDIIGSLRWGNQTQWVYKRGEEYVRVTDVAPATEYQDWGDYGDPEIVTVVPKTKTITVTTYHTLA